MSTAEDERLAEDSLRDRYWKRFGPYLAERQWGTVREDYSGDQNSWTYFTHDQARSRAYRWGEDGLLGICDRQARMCFALALWNGQDTILKERLFGLAGPEGNHGEDVKELYYYLDATPTASYLKALYKYPQQRFPYERLCKENADRKHDLKLPEFELVDTGIFDQGYFDVLVEYAKADPDDILIRISVSNRGSVPAPLYVLPTLWFRNTWSWGRTGEGYAPKPVVTSLDELTLSATHAELGTYVLSMERDPGVVGQLFTDNESNSERLFGVKGVSAHVKDAFHRYIVAGERGVLREDHQGTKAAWQWQAQLEPGETRVLKLRLGKVQRAF